MLSRVLLPGLERCRCAQFGQEHLRAPATTRANLTPKDRISSIVEQLKSDMFYLKDRSRTAIGEALAVLQVPRASLTGQQGLSRRRHAGVVNTARPVAALASLELLPAFAPDSVSARLYFRAGNLQGRLFYNTPPRYPACNNRPMHSHNSLRC